MDDEFKVIIIVLIICGFGLAGVLYFNQDYLTQFNNIDSTIPAASPLVHG